MPKVIAMKCSRYEPEAVTRNLKAALDRLGGVRTLMHPGSRVFLKVNLLTGRKPGEGVTTHPVVVQAVAGLFIEAGMRVTIGDSPGGPFLPARLKQIYRITGMEAAAQYAGAQLNNNLNAVVVDYPEGRRLMQFECLQGVVEADYVVSLCKMKTHSMTLMTGAVKNLFGVMPGLTKAALHFRFPRLEDFAHAMVDICEYVQPVLSIMDGIEAMEGAGPSAGSVTDANVLLVSTSPHYLDLAASRWMKIPPDEVPLLRAASERNLCDLNGSDLEWEGAEPDDERRPFKTPTIHVPDFLQRYHHIPVAGRLIKVFNKVYLRPRPRVNPKVCIACRECHVICPAEAISIENQRPVFNLTKCIRCFCCQEICPAKAISIHRSRLLRSLHAKDESVNR